MTKFEWFKHEWIRCKEILAADDVIYASGKSSHACAEDCLFELRMLAPEFGKFDGITGKLVGMREFDLQSWRNQNADILA